MNKSRQAIEVLVEAEASLSALMKDSIEHHRYEEVAAVADIAHRFSDFIKALEGQPPHVRDGKSDSSRRATGTHGGKRTKSSGATSGFNAARRDSYPRFRRDGDRLVKVGWSRKGREEYEHRAPSSVIWAFAGTLRDQDKESPFRMEDLLPVTSDAGAELPSYQAYVVLAWLRSEGVVTKDGRDGYRADTVRLDEEPLRDLWASVPSYRRTGSEETEE
jgi:hypothetical protein